MIRTIMLAMLTGAAAASAAQLPVAFTPEPRWHDEPDTREFCAAARRECPAAFHGDTVQGEVSYEELYDARGMLVGVRRARGSGCAPLDDKVLLDRRDFHLAFREEDEPDAAIRAEFDGTSGAGGASAANSVRIVKRGTTALSIACTPPVRTPRPIEASAPLDDREPLPDYIENPEAAIGLTPAPEPL